MDKKDFIGGIPLSIFSHTQPVENRSALSGSGRQLKYTYIPGRSVHIKDQRDAHFYFTATLVREKTPIDPQHDLCVLHMEVRTKDNEGNYGDDFFASKLIEQTINDFSLKGQHVDVILGDWRSEVALLIDNWNMYVQSKYGDHRSEREAAFLTPTGKIAQKLLYTNVKVVEESSGNIKAYFYKEQSRIAIKTLSRPHE